MTDIDLEAVPARPSRWHVAIDTRDVIGVVGIALALGAAYATDWRLCVGVVGCSLAALAYRLSR